MSRKVMRSMGRLVCTTAMPDRNKCLFLEALVVHVGVKLPHIIPVVDERF